MFVDRNTLADLGLIIPTNSGPRAAEWLDCTETPEGGAALLKYLHHPLGEIDAIEGRQRDIRRLAGIRKQISWTALNQAALAVRHYLRSPLVESPESQFRCLLLARGYSDQCASLLAGLGATAALGSQFESLLQLLASSARDRDAGRSQASHDLQDVSDSLSLVVSSPQFAAVRRAATRSGQFATAKLLSLDAPVRQDLRETLERSFDALARLDALCALSALTERPGFTVPEFLRDDSRTVAFDGLFHPELARPVPNDVCLSQECAVMVLTGPNMAGKSTFLRSLGIALVLAHVGAPIPAFAARIKPVDYLLTSLSVQESVRNGESYFLAEVRQMKRIIAQIIEHSFVVALIDEPFRGTNIADAADATDVLLDGLINAASTLAIVATHLVDSATRLSGHGRVQPKYFAASLDPSGIAFDYHLAEGVSSQRLGMLLLEREGVLRMIRSIVLSAANDPFPVEHPLSNPS